jgi:hypothetical protein
MKNETVVTNGTETAIINDEDLDLIKECIGTAMEEYKIMSDNLYNQANDIATTDGDYQTYTWAKNRMKYFDSQLQRCQELLVKLHMVEHMWQKESEGDTDDILL